MVLASFRGGAALAGATRAGARDPGRGGGRGRLRAPWRLRRALLAPGDGGRDTGGRLRARGRRGGGRPARPGLAPRADPRPRRRPRDRPAARDHARGRLRRARRPRRRGRDLVPRRRVGRSRLRASTSIPPPARRRGCAWTPTCPPARSWSPITTRPASPIAGTTSTTRSAPRHWSGPRRPVRPDERRIRTRLPGRWIGYELGGPPAPARRRRKRGSDRWLARRRDLRGRRARSWWPPGSQVAPPERHHSAMTRDTERGILAGVLAGFARRLDIDPLIVRLSYAVLVVVSGGVALVAYPIAWYLMPGDGAPKERAVARQRSGRGAAAAGSPSASGCWCSPCCSCSVSWASGGATRSSGRSCWRRPARRCSGASPPYAMRARSRRLPASPSLPPEDRPSARVSPTSTAAASASRSWSARRSCSSTPTARSRRRMTPRSPPWWCWWAPAWCSRPSSGASAATSPPSAPSGSAPRSARSSRRTCTTRFSRRWR